MQNKHPQTKKSGVPLERRSLEPSGEREDDSSPCFSPCLSRLFQEKPEQTTGLLDNIRPKKWSPHFYLWGFLVIFAVVNFGGCCTPTSKSQILGQSPKSEWDTPAENTLKNTRPKRNFLTPVITFLKRDTEEDYILVGKPISFANSSKHTEWDIPEPAPSLILQANYISPSPANSEPIQQVSSILPAKPRKLASEPTDSPEIVNLISTLNACESVNQARAESFLAELRKIDRSQIKPEFYQYTIDRVRSDLIPVPEETVDEIVAAPKPVNPPPTPLRKKTSNVDSKKIAKNVPKIEITEEKIEEKPAAPVPTPTAVAESSIPTGRFSEPIREEVPSPQVNPGGYSSKETFRQFENNTPWVTSVAPKYGSTEQAAPQQDWEQATSYAIGALKNKILQTPNPDATITDQLRLQILEATLYGENLSIKDSRRYSPGYDETVQSFVSNELFALATLLEERNSPEFAMRLQAAQPHFQEAQKQLAKSCPLRIHNLQFIQNSPDNPQPGDFRGFGVYTPIKAEFKTKDWAWVYLEMDNFVTTGNETVGFQTKFSISYEILDMSGNNVMKKNLPMTEETTKSPRRDMALTVPLDLDIAPGHYRAMIRITDQNHLRLQMDTQRIDFIVRAEEGGGRR